METIYETFFDTNETSTTLEEMESLREENAQLKKRIKYINRQCCRALMGLGLSMLENTPFEVFSEDEEEFEFMGEEMMDDMIDDMQ